MSPGKSSLHSIATGCTALFSSHSRGNGPEDPLKKDSQGLSRVVARNPGFPRLVTVPSKSFSGCIWEVRCTVVLGGASRHSTGFGVMEEDLFSS